MLLMSQRTMNFNRSRMGISFESEPWFQIVAGELKVFLPTEPTVYAAGYWNALWFRYGFWAEVGNRFGPMSQS
jgi:hypothetical protein